MNFCRGSTQPADEYLVDGIEPVDIPLPLMGMGYFAPHAAPGDDRGLHLHPYYGVNVTSSTFSTKEQLKASASTMAGDVTAFWPHPVYPDPSKDEAVLPSVTLRITPTQYMKLQKNDPTVTPVPWPVGVKLLTWKGKPTRLEFKINRRKDQTDQRGTFQAKYYFPNCTPAFPDDASMFLPKATFNLQGGTPVARPTLIAIAQYELITQAELARMTDREVKQYQDHILATARLSSGDLSTLHGHLQTGLDIPRQQRMMDAWSRGQTLRINAPDDRFLDKNGNRVHDRNGKLLQDRVNIPALPQHLRPGTPSVTPPKPAPNPVPPVVNPPTDNTTALDLINQARGIMDRLEVEVRKG